MKKIMLLSLFFLLPLSTFAKVKVEKEIHYYSINPKSKKDLSSEMLKKSPAKKDGKKVYGDTKWDIHTSYEFKGKCRITKVHVDLSINTLLPKLTSKKSIKFNVKSPFRKFESKLISYQKTHEKYAKQAAKEIHKKLLSYGSPKDCDKARKVMRGDINNIIRKYKLKSKEYDKKTDYGRKKGVKI